MSPQVTGGFYRFHPDDVCRCEIQTQDEVTLVMTSANCAIHGADPVRASASAGSPEKNNIAKRCGLLADVLVRTKPSHISREQLDDTIVTLRIAEAAVIDLNAEIRTFNVMLPPLHAKIAELKTQLQSASSAPPEPPRVNESSEPEEPLKLTVVHLNETNDKPVSAVCILTGCQHMTLAAPPEQELIEHIDTWLSLYPYDSSGAGRTYQGFIAAHPLLERLRAALASRLTP